MPSLTKTTRSKPKLQLQLQAATQPTTTSTHSSRSSSPQLSPNLLLLSSPPTKKFHLKNLRRITSQANLQRATSTRGLDGQTDDNNGAEYPTSALSQTHYSIASGNSLDVFELQAQIAALNKSLAEAQENLKFVDTERQLWKRKARDTQETLKKAVENSEVLEQRCSELQEDDVVLRERIEKLEERSSSREDSLRQENEKLRMRVQELERRAKEERRLSNASSRGSKKEEEPCVEQSTAVRALVMHHWNMQAEMATNVGRERDWCGCVAARTVKALMKDGSAGVSSVLKSSTMEEYASPSASPRSGSVSGLSGDRASQMQLVLPPHPHPEIFEDARRKRKEALKRKVHDMRGYVEGLRRENDALESLLDGEGRQY